MATGGQDGKVVVWDLAASAVPRRGEDEDTDESTTDGRKNADDSEPSDYADATATAVVEEGVDRSGAIDASGAGGGGGRDAFSAVPISVGSGLSDDALSAERESSDLGSGGIMGGKSSNFSGLEVRVRCAISRGKGGEEGRLCSPSAAVWCARFLEP